MLAGAAVRIGVGAALAAAVLTASAASNPLQAQGARITAHVSTPSLTTAGGAVVTSVFVITNLTDDTIPLKASLDLPKGWATIGALAPSHLSPAATDTWLAGVSVPSNAVAGRYIVRGTVASGTTVAMDSITIVVSEHHEIEVLPLEAPGWSIMGARFEAQFLVRNNGNVAATVLLAGQTSRGTRADADPQTVTLAAGASTRVTVRVATSATMSNTVDDIIELTAREAGDSKAIVSASLRTTIIPRPAHVSSYATIPGMLSVRSIGGAAGVSPIVLSGYGNLGESGTTLDFLLQAPTNQTSQWGFGEREEYRATLRTADYRVRAGDQLFGWSPLTSSGTLGAGAELEGVRGNMQAGVYAQQLRWLPGSRNEEAAFVGIGDDSVLHGSATAMFRQSRLGVGVGVGSLGGEARVLGNGSLQVEAAASDSASATGLGYRARLIGTFGHVSYDAGYLRGDRDFVGPTRGATYQGASVSSPVWRALTMSASASANDWGTNSVVTNVAGQHMGTANASMSWGGMATLDYGWLKRTSGFASPETQGTQNGVRLSSARHVGQFTFVVGLERGVVVHTDTTPRNSYTQYTLGIQTLAGRAGSLGVSGTYNKGSTLTGARDGFLNFGANAQLTLPYAMTVAISSSAQRATFGMLDSSGAWFSVSDARIDHRFENGSTVGLHARMLQSPFSEGSTHNTAVYLEYKMPLHVPTGPSRAHGRAVARVTNAEDGTPVPNVLVRLGDRAAVTDREGRADFSGLKPLNYSVSIDATGEAAGAMVVGDVVVDMRDQRPTPTEFAVSVTRGAQIAATIHAFAKSSTIGTGADSLIDAGPLGSVLVRLEGVRDTVYQSTDEHGRADFGSVAPGTYTLSVPASDAPAQTKFEHDRISVVLKPGDRNSVSFRAIPNTRAIKFLPPPPPPPENR